jgi:RNA methyltransferase, TrmH family
LSPITQADKKKAKSLLTRKGRDAHQQFVAEGIRLLEESIRHQWLPTKIYYAASRLGKRGEELLEKFRGLQIELAAVSVRDLEQMTDTETSQGLLGLFDIPKTSSEHFMKSDCRNILLLDNISDPGNAGTLIRSALAFEFDYVVATGNTVEPFNPKTIRSSAGAFFGIPIISLPTERIASLKREKDMTLITADPSGEPLVEIVGRLRPGARIILGIGSEAAGLSEPIRELADYHLRIIHNNNVESLNAAVAGSILMKELFDLRKLKQ